MYQVLHKYLNDNYNRLQEIAQNITNLKNEDTGDLLHETILYLNNIDKEKVEKMVKKNNLLFI